MRADAFVMVGGRQRLPRLEWIDVALILLAVIVLLFLTMDWWGPQLGDYK